MTARPSRRAMIGSTSPNSPMLRVIPETPEGLRDRAITLTLVLTGRRRSEILNLKAGNISQSGGFFYTYRGKGGKRAKRELPRPAFEAIETALAAWGRSIAEMETSEPPGS